jgi:hypothetical protein
MSSHVQVHEKVPAAGHQRSSPDRLMRKCSKCKKNEDDEKKVLQRKDGVGGAGPQAVPPIVHEVLQGPGKPLDTQTRAFFEPRFGHDFSRIRVYHGDLAAESARAVNALAYTFGERIVFGSGQYIPHSNVGQRLLAHELAHTVQAGTSVLQAAPVITDSGPTDPAESEARHAAADVMADQPPKIALKGASKILHRFIVDEPVAGCGICKAPTLVGTDVHQLIQGSFPPTYQVEATFHLPMSPGKGRLDLLHITLSPENPPSTVEIGEIKPNNPEGIKDGENDLQFYMGELAKIFPFPQWEIERMALAPPPISTLYHDGVSLACPAQAVSMINSAGLYLYSCSPPRSTVSKNCCLPFVPVPKKKDVKVDDKKEIKDDDKGKDYPPYGPPIPVPVQARDIALLLAVLAAGGIMLSKMSRVARARALGYLSVIAATVLLANGAEASVGLEGDDALEALIKLSESKGQTIPDDIKDAMRKDPALKATLTKAVKTGNFNEAQRETGERLIRVIAEHRGEFSEEELDILFKASEGVKGSIPQGELTVEDIKRQIEMKRRGGQGMQGPGVAGSSSHSESDSPTEEVQPTPAQPDVKIPTPPPLPEPAQRLKEVLVKRHASGSRITKSELLELHQLLTSVTPPLTDAEVNTLLTRVVPAEGKTTADMLNSVRKAISQIRSPQQTASNEPAESAAGGNQPPGTTSAPGTSKGSEAGGEPPGTTSAPGTSKGSKPDGEPPGTIPAPIEDPKKIKHKSTAEDQAVGEIYAKKLAEGNYDFLQKNMAYLRFNKSIVLKVNATHSGWLFVRGEDDMLCMGAVHFTVKKIISKDVWIFIILGGAKLYGQNGRFYTYTKTSAVQFTVFHE